MKKSKYNFMIAKGDWHLLYNAATNACVVLDSKTYSKWDNLETNEEENINYKRLGLFIGDDVNEVDAFFYSTRKRRQNNKNLFYRIYTTTECNAHCFYCYEKGIEKQVLSQEMADKICEKIISEIENEKQIKLEWFGGEPLLNKNIITYVCNKLSKLLKNKNIEFFSNMVTNGILFDNETIKEAKKIWKLKSVQITLDGTKEIYENIKDYDSSIKNPFEAIIANIDNLAKNDIHVSIRLNFNERNINNILELIDFLGEKYSNNKNVSVYAHKLMFDDIDNSFTASQDDDIRIINQLHKVGLLKNALSSFSTRVGCFASNLKGGVIYPNGSIYKCSIASCSEKEGNSVGNINDENYNDNIVKWCSLRLSEKCYDCKLLPLCNGGCIYERLCGKNECFASEKTLLHSLSIALDDFIAKQVETNIKGG